MAIVTYGAGFGRTYTKPVPVEDRSVKRIENTLEVMVGGQKVTLILRDTVVPEDPYLNLARAAAYAKMTGKVFPAPRVPRSIKDHMIRLNIST